MSANIIKDRVDLDALAEIIAARAGETAEKSYTASLLAGGPERAAKKFGEETEMS